MAGYYSQIDIITDSQGKYITKLVAISTDKSQAIETREQVLLQRKLLKQAGISVSELLNIKLVEQNGVYHLLMKERFAGYDFMEIVDHSNFSMYFGQVLEEIYQALLQAEFLQTESGYLQAGLDPVLRNYVYDTSQKTFRYVDFLPPKVLWKGTFVQEIPDLPKGEFRKIREYNHNTISGLFYVSYINIVRKLPQMKKIALGVMERFAQEQADDRVMQDILASPLYRETNPQKALQILGGIEDWHGQNYFLLRELANWILERNHDFQELHAEVYHLSHHVHDPADTQYGKVRDADFQKIKKILQTGLKSINAT